MDGIDAALLQTDGENQLVELGHVQLVYSTEIQWLLKAAERAVQSAKGDLRRANQFYVAALRSYLQDELQLNLVDLQAALLKLSSLIQEKFTTTHPLSLTTITQLSTQQHAEAVAYLLATTGYQSAAIDVIGYHGQTLLHNPGAKLSIQMGDGALLARLTAIRVVNQFRQADLAAGGQGAPLAPLFHQALAKRDGKIPLIVANCGGIANITLIRNTEINDLIGFDTGPGNNLVDRLVRQRTQGQEIMDKDGQYGRAGQMNQSVLKQLMHKALAKKPGYLNAKPPKSLDSHDLTLIPELASLSLVDACATLEYFTAKTLIDSLDKLPLASNEIPYHWILAGGGWYNPVIRDNLVTLLQERCGSHVRVETADEAGWSTAAMEAQLFAYLAVRSIKRLPLSVPGTTGVPEPLTGGELHEPLLSD